MIYLFAVLASLAVTALWCMALWQRRAAQESARLLAASLASAEEAVRESSHRITRSLARESRHLRQKMDTQWGPQGELVTFEDDGLPMRMSTRPRSPYYFPGDFAVSLDGAPVERCFEVDRGMGWVLCMDADLRPQPRRYGHVEVQSA